MSIDEGHPAAELARVRSELEESRAREKLWRDEYEARSRELTEERLRHAARAAADKATIAVLTRVSAGHARSPTAGEHRDGRRVVEREIAAELRRRAKWRLSARARRMASVPGLAEAIFIALEAAAEAIEQSDYRRLDDRDATTP